jgi:hypothetical protein
MPRSGCSSGTCGHSGAPTRVLLATKNPAEHASSAAAANDRLEHVAHDHAAMVIAAMAASTWSAAMGAPRRDADEATPRRRRSPPSTALGGSPIGR